MINIENFIRELRSEADIDFTWLWQIASSFEDELGADDQREIRYNTLKVVRGLMALDVLPGDYSFAETSFRFWPGTAEEQLDRIETEWIAMGVTPNVGDPICCFSLRPANIEGDAAWIDGNWMEVRPNNLVSL